MHEVCIFKYFAGCFPIADFVADDSTMDKVKEALLTALKQAMAEEGEQRLFRSGKVEGLFPSKTGVHAEASQRALNDDLLEVVRTETKGKTQVEWVRLTTKGQDFVRRGESPARAMDELSDILRTTQEGLPVWVEQIQQQLAEVTGKLVEEVHSISRRLAVLGERVENAIRATSVGPDPSTNGRQQTVQWAGELLDYLDCRQEKETPCPLSEVFAALRMKHKDLTIKEFHSGIRRLYDRGLIKLSAVVNGELPQPEYALLVDSTLYYYVDR